MRLFLIRSSQGAAKPLSRGGQQTQTLLIQFALSFDVLFCSTQFDSTRSGDYAPRSAIPRRSEVGSRG
jgi:hypothetical protein